MPNQTGSNQGGKSGQPNKGADDKPAKKSADSKKSGVSKSASSGTRGGTHEQHVKAGEQSHKNAK